MRIICINEIHINFQTNSHLNFSILCYLDLTTLQISLTILCKYLQWHNVAISTCQVTIAIIRKTTSISRHKYYWRNANKTNLYSHTMLISVHTYVYVSLSKEPSEQQEAGCVQLAKTSAKAKVANQTSNRHKSKREEIEKVYLL